jgi:hypothetical protein
MADYASFIRPIGPVVMSHSMTTENLARSVLVVVDPNYGERLRRICPPGRPAWIAMSPINEPTVRSLWASHPDTDYLTGITSFNFDPDVLPENSFLNYLGTIDLHHGADSSEFPYTSIEVIGARLAIDVREALGELGFDEFVEHPDGFSARRSA